MKIIKLTSAVLLLLAVAALSGAGRPEAAGAAADDTGKGITVTGAADVRATPDRAQLSFSVESRGATAAKALAANSVDVRRLIAALKNAGVAAKDLKTEHLDVSPRHDEKGERTGDYSASSALVVSEQPLDRASRLADVAVSAGAQTVSGPSLSVADRDAQYRRALERAYADAETKAKALADAAGVSIGEVTAIVEESAGDEPVWLARSADAQASGAPIEPGSETVSASVTVTFALGG